MGMIYGAKLTSFFHSDNKIHEKYWILGDYLLSCLLRHNILRHNSTCRIAGLK